MAVREAIPRQEEAQEGVSSFAKSLFLGEIHEELVFPWPASRMPRSRTGSAS